MLKIDIIGRGNVALHLVKAFEGKADTTIVNPRTIEGLRADSDIYLISVTDKAIPEVFSRIKDAEGIIAHTSGSTGISMLEREKGRYGVFYPLQTFSKASKPDYSTIPVFVEASDTTSKESLMEAARLFSGNVKEASSELRGKLHLASVFSCNFVNHLWAIADAYLKENGGDFRDLLPLIDETCRKIHSKTPAECQTGPAIRLDYPTIELQMQKLDSTPESQQIYEALTESIIQMHHKTEKRDERNKL